MELTFNYILSQIFSLLCFACFGITFFSKNQKNIRFLGILMNVFQAISYMFLGATNGWAMLVIATLRNVIFFKLSKQEYTLSYKLLLVGLLIVIGITGAITYKNLFSLLPVFAIVLYSIGVWQKSPKIYKLLSIPNCLLWVIYNISVASIVASIDETVMLVLSIIGFCKEFDNKEKNKRRTYGTLFY